MGLINVTAATLKSKATELKGINSQFKNQVSTLDSIEMNLNSQWEGEANTAFHAAFQKDKAQFEAFNQLIDQYCIALETIANKYEMAENINTQTATTRTY